jgi:CcmD family protein
MNKFLKKAISALIFAGITKHSFAQQVNEIAMADTMRAEGKIYVVIAVIALVFAGIAAYLIYIDRKVSRIENELKNK